MLKVLLVDDEQLEREALRLILREAPEEIAIVGEATTGGKAVELGETCEPDLVFMDIRIPGMDALEAAKILRESDAKRAIILLAGYDDSSLAPKAYRAGANECLTKPLRPAEIFRIINTYRAPRPQIQKMDARFVDGSTEAFLERIHLEDYKGAKEQLKLLFREIIERATSLEQLRKQAQSIAEQMVKIYEAKGLQRNSAAKQWAQIGEIVTPFQAEEQVSKILDQMFDDIIHHHSIKEKNEIQAVLNYIEANYRRGVTLEEAAEYVHLSPHYLSKLFKKELNVNFVNYVMERRIEMAKELLENTDMPVLNIALELSYQEHNYFSKVFKKVVGVTPSEYRKAKEREKEKNNQGLLKRYSYIGNGKWYI